MKITMQAVLDGNLETNVPDLFLAGSIIDAPSIRVSANQGHRVAAHIARTIGARKGGKEQDGVKDLIIAGAGPAGLNAAMTGISEGLDVLVLDEYFMGSTILTMPEGKVFDIHFKNVHDPPEGPLWYETSPAPVLHLKWTEQVRSSGIPLHEHEEVCSIVRDPKTGLFDVATSVETYRSRNVLVSIGMMARPRRLNVQGEMEMERKRKVAYRFRGPGPYAGKDVLVVGGGNSAVETAIALSGTAQVTLSYRHEEFTRLTPENNGQIGSLMADEKVKVFFGSNITRFEDDEVMLICGGKLDRMSYDAILVLIGFETPQEFLKGMGVAFR